MTLINKMRIAILLVGIGALGLAVFGGWFLFSLSGLQWGLLGGAAVSAVLLAGAS